MHVQMYTVRWYMWYNINSKVVQYICVYLWMEAATIV